METQFSSEALREIERIKARYPAQEKAAPLIPVLRLACREFGYLSREVMELVARTLDIPESVVMSTATFYTLLRKRPVGKYHIQVCQNVACFLRGCDEIVAHLKHILGIGFGEVTQDGMFSLEGVECLASCGTAPVIQVNDEYHEEMTVEKVTSLIERLRSEGGQR